MFKQAAKIKDQAPLHRNTASVSGPFKGVAPSSPLKSFQQGTDAGWDRNGVGAGHASLGAGEGDRAGMQIDQSQVQPGLTQSAAGVVSDLKRDAHPFFGRIHGQMIGKAAPHGRDFVVRKDRPLCDGRFSGSVVEHRHRADFAQQTALPVQPFHELDVVGRQIAADGLAVGSRDGRAPGDILLRVGGGKVMETKPMLLQKSGDPVPAVAVVPARRVANRVGRNQAVHPRAKVSARLGFLHRHAGRLLSGLGPVKRVVRPVSRGLGRPRSGLGFKTNPVPRTVFSFVDCSHVTIVTNHPKTQQNKG